MLACLLFKGWTWSSYILVQSNLRWVKLWVCYICLCEKHANIEGFCRHSHNFCRFMHLSIQCKPHYFTYREDSQLQGKWTFFDLQVSGEFDLYKATHSSSHSRNWITSLYSHVDTYNYVNIISCPKSGEFDKRTWSNFLLCPTHPLTGGNGAQAVGLTIDRCINSTVLRMLIYSYIIIIASVQYKHNALKY